MSDGFYLTLPPESLVLVVGRLRDFQWDWPAIAAYLGYDSDAACRDSFLATRRKLGRPPGQSNASIALEREHTIVVLRADGKTWQQIASTCGFSHGSKAKAWYARRLASRQ